MIIKSNLKSLKKNLRHNFSIAVFILFLKSLIVVKRPNDKRNEVFDFQGSSHRKYISENCHKT